MTLLVAPLSQVEAVARAARPSRLVTLMHADPPVPTPAGVAAGHHLVLPMNDITKPMAGYTLASERHVADLLAFARDWDRRSPMLLHCWMGISRSTAAAFVIACALRPDRDPEAVADALRAASPSATPNPRIVALADAYLRREGRMSAAVARIGRGAEAFEGTPFRLDIDPA